MSLQDDQADVERVLAGDLSTFEGIVRRWQKPLVNLAYRFCRDRTRAEDMAQDAFLRAYRSLSQWRREAAFSTWLFALAANVYRTIPFPWKRALAGIFVLAALLILVAVEFVLHIRMDSDLALVLSRAIVEWNAGLDWLALALSISLAALALTKRLTSG